MPLLKNEAIIDDEWGRIADDAAIPEAGKVIVGLARWKAERDLLVARGDVGVFLKSDEGPEEMADDLEHVSVIALDFPAFTDGRAYSGARLLRDRYGYTGELRAVGEVLRDQYAFMLRCGFDAFEIPAGTNPEEWGQAAGAIRVFYQPGMARGAAAMTLRHGRAIVADRSAHN